jgi:glycosyltransferase involved in cell wall biosynthesis
MDATKGLDSGIAPAVSVVIPAFNASAFIEKTLTSVRAQTYDSYEVIVVDDGSSDNTKDVVEAYLKRNVMSGRCIRQQNKKIAGARNTGMRAARGRYIALLDHDDLWRPEKLAVVMRVFDSHPEVDLVCHAEDVVKDGHIIRTQHYGPAVPQMYERLLFLGNAVSPSASVFKTEAARAIGGFDENPDFNTAEDYEFWLRMSRNGRFNFIDAVLGEYVMAKHAASRQIEYHHINAVNVLRHHFSMYASGRPAFFDRLRMRRRISTVYRSALRQFLQSNGSPVQQRTFLIKMLLEFPVEPKNIAVGLIWALQTLKNNFYALCHLGTKVA